MLSYTVRFKTNTPTCTLLLYSFQIISMIADTGGQIGSSLLYSSIININFRSLARYERCVCLGVFRPIRHFNCLHYYQTETTRPQRLRLLGSVRQTGNCFISVISPIYRFLDRREPKRRRSRLDLRRQ